MSELTIKDPLGLKQHIRWVIQKKPKNSNFFCVDNDPKAIEAALPEVKVYNQKISKEFKYENLDFDKQSKLGIHIDQPIDHFDVIVFSKCDFSKVGTLYFNSIDAVSMRFEHCTMPQNLRLNRVVIDHLNFTNCFVNENGRPEESDCFIKLHRGAINRLSFSEFNKPTNKQPVKCSGNIKIVCTTKILSDLFISKNEAEISCELDAEYCENIKIEKNNSATNFKTKHSSINEVIIQENGNGLVEFDVTHCKVTKTTLENNQNSTTKYVNCLIDEIKLPKSNVGKNLDLKFTECTFSTDLNLSTLYPKSWEKFKIDLSNSQIKKCLHLPNEVEKCSSPKGMHELILRNVTCDVLCDKANSWPNADSNFLINLIGFRYNSLDSFKLEESTQTDGRIAQLFNPQNPDLQLRIDKMLKNTNVIKSNGELRERAENGKHDPDAPKTDIIDKPSWKTLSDALSNSGHTRLARDVILTRKRNERADLSSHLEKCTSYGLQLVANFGYSPYRPLGFFFLTLVAVWLILIVANQLTVTQNYELSPFIDNILVFLGNEANHTRWLELIFLYVDNPKFCSIGQGASSSVATIKTLMFDQTCRVITHAELFFLILDWMLPILELGFVDKWVVQTGDWTKNIVMFVFILLRVFGAALIAISIFSFTGFLSRDD